VLRGIPGEPRLLSFRSNLELGGGGGGKKKPLLTIPAPPFARFSTLPAGTSVEYPGRGVRPAIGNCRRHTSWLGSGNFFKSLGTD